MKIYNNQNDLAFDKDFRVDMLDLKNVDNQGDLLRIPIIDNDIILHMNDIVWNFAESHDWISIDDDKVKSYLYISLIDNDISIMIESFPYLPFAEDIKKELEGMDDDEQQLIQGYYNDIKDWYNNNSCGEFDCVRIEFEDCEFIEIQKNLKAK